MTWSTFVARAIEHVLQNKGARTPGIDGKTRKHYDSAHARLLWQREIIRTLRSGSYRPAPVRRVFIDKPGKPGEKRPLGIPPLVDRCVQFMLKSVLEPVFEGSFHPHSYGFRPYRSTHHAVQRVRNLIQSGYHWVVEGDIRKFFDRVNHDILLHLVRRKIGDPKLLRLVRAFLKVGVLEDGAFSVAEEGTPQGGILSPLLANIYLNELDWYVARKYETLSDHYRAKQPFGCFICRYADDFVVLVRGTLEDAEALKAGLTSFLTTTLQLELSAEKTLITHVDDGFDFLGFHIRRYHRNGKATVLASPSKKAQTKFRQRTRELTRNVSRRGDSFWIVQLNEYLAGWAEHFRRANSKRIFSKLDHTLWWLIALRMRGRWKRTRKTGGFGPFLRASLIPYAFDWQHPHYRHRGSSHFGHWIDSEKTAALIVDRLSHHPIRYPHLFPQADPYTREGREKLEALRRSGRLVTVLERESGPAGRTSPQGIALLQRWLMRQKNRCQRCQKEFDKTDIRQIQQRLAKRLLVSYKVSVSLQCTSCSGICTK